MQLLILHNFNTNSNIVSYTVDVLYPTQLMYDVIHVY